MEGAEMDTPDGGEDAQAPPYAPGWGDAEPPPYAPGWGEALPYFDAGPVPPAAPPVRRRRRTVGALAAGVLVAGGAVAAGLAVSGSHHTTLVGDALVTAAAQHTLAQKTADVELSGSVAVNGLTVPLHGTGMVDFGASTMSLDVNAAFSGHSLHEQVVGGGGGDFYLGMTIDGRSLSAMTGGYDWVQIPIASSGGPNLTSDPASALTALEQQGASVTSLGTETIDGTSCRGYEVVPSQQAMISGAKKEFAAMGLSPAVASAALQQVESGSPPKIDVWFDSHQLTRQMKLNMQLGSVGSAGSDSTAMTMTFTRFGVPVHISTPAPGDSISLGEFLKRVAQAQQSQAG